MINATISPEQRYGAGRDPWTAALLSIIPGLGQLYIGDRRKGILFLDVTGINVVLLGLMLCSKQIIEGLQKFGSELHFALNVDFMGALAHAHLGTPASFLLLALMGTFALYAARDAYDQAAGLRRRLLYRDHFFELSEATSGSYLMHFALMGACAVLALFFLTPPPKFIQTTQIFLDLEPTKAQRPEKETDNVAAHQSVKSGRKDPTRPAVAVKPSGEAEPQLSAPKKSALPEEDSKQSSRQSTGDSAPPRPSPMPLKLASALPQPKPLSALDLPTIPKSMMPDSKLPRAMQLAQLPTLPMPTVSRASLDALVLQASTLRSSVPLMPLPHLATQRAGASFATAAVDPLTLPAPVAFSRPTGGAPLASLGPKMVNNISGTAAAPSPMEVRRPLGQTGNSSLAPGEALTVTRGNGTHESDVHTPQRIAANSASGAGSFFATQPRGAAVSPQNALPNPDVDSAAGPVSFDATRAEFGPYMADLQRRIRKHWFPPQNYESRRVVVCFTVAKNGEMTDLQMVNGSGHPPADAAALNAIRNASPLKELPSHAPESVDIEFTFDYTVFSGH